MLDKLGELLPYIRGFVTCFFIFWVFVTFNVFLRLACKRLSYSFFKTCSLSYRVKLKVKKMTVLCHVVQTSPAGLDLQFSL